MTSAHVSEYVKFHILLVRFKKKSVNVFLKAQIFFILVWMHIPVRRLHEFHIPLKQFFKKSL